MTATRKLGTSSFKQKLKAETKDVGVDRYFHFPSILEFKEVGF